MTPRVVFCWSQIPGYMAPCWRELAKTVDARVIALAPRMGEVPVAPDLLAGYSVQLLTEGEIEDSATVLDKLRSHDPHVLVVPGWAHASYRDAVAWAHRRDIPVVMCMDNPWRSIARTAARRVWSGKYLRSMHAVVVPGERGRHYAERLGIAPAKIHTGLYGIDYSQLATVIGARSEQDAPRRFLYMGQLNRRKGLDVLLRGYGIYREQSPDAWALTVCGAGPMEKNVVGQRGVHFEGFVAPRDQPALLARHGVFVMLSRFDPWPLAIVEASAAGLPVVCTAACGSAVEVVRDRYSGLVLQEASVDRVVWALTEFEQTSSSQLFAMGLRASRMAAAYSAEVWAARWHSLLTQAVRSRWQG